MILVGVNNVENSWCMYVCYEHLLLIWIAEKNKWISFLHVGLFSPLLESGIPIGASNLNLGTVITQNANLLKKQENRRKQKILAT